MKRKIHTPEQVLALLVEGDRMLNKGATIAEVAKHFGITETTWHRWKKTFGEMKGQDLKRLKELEKENRRLKAIVADQSLHVIMLRELAQGNVLPRIVVAVQLNY